MFIVRFACSSEHYRSSLTECSTVPDLLCESCYCQWERESSVRQESMWSLVCVYVCVYPMHSCFCRHPFECTFVSISLYLISHVKVSFRINYNGTKKNIVVVNILKIGYEEKEIRSNVVALCCSVALEDARLLWNVLLADGSLKSEIITTSWGASTQRACHCACWPVRVLLKQIYFPQNFIARSRVKMISRAVTPYWQTEAEAILEEDLINLMNSSYLTTTMHKVPLEAQLCRPQMLFAFNLLKLKPFYCILLIKLPVDKCNNWFSWVSR